jgi:hypothetical protein
MAHRIRFSVLIPLLLSATPLPAAEKGLRGGAAGYPAEVTIAVEGDVRVIRSNGIPAHETGQFPGRGNPNTIAPQRYEFRVPANPKAAERPTPLRMQPFGVAVNGVVFDPGAAEWWNGERQSGWQYEPLTMPPPALGVDASHAHVQPNGAYHYHGIPTGLLHALTDGKPKTVLIGWAADGFPIYNDLGHADANDAASPLKTLKSSYKIKSGDRPSGPGGKPDGTFVADYEYVAGAGDLDECNGRIAATPEYPNGTYHYVLTEQFPYVPRLYRGTPDPSFARRGPGGGGGGGGGAPGNRAGGPGAGGGGAVHVIPRFAVEVLNLTPEQEKQVAELDREARAKLEKILTPEQMNALDQARPPRRGPAPPPLAD